VVGADRVVFHSDAARLDEVAACGRRLGRALRPGDLVFLVGPLGAGKTTLVRAVAEALLVTDPVRSPSFTIANIYAGRFTVQHLDLYRLEALADEDALALEEYARPDAVTLVEWPQAGMERLGPPAWTVLLDHVSVESRSLEIAAATEDACARWEEARERG
jgi:tRNA threonylcarbamoyladenosine biosynthesis protein TsaE